MVPTTPQHTMQCDDDGDGDGDNRSQEIPIRSPYVERDRLARVSSIGDSITEHHFVRSWPLRLVSRSNQGTTLLRRRRRRSNFRTPSLRMNVGRESRRLTLTVPRAVSAQDATNVPLA